MTSRTMTFRLLLSSLPLLLLPWSQSTLAEPRDQGSLPMPAHTYEITDFTGISADGDTQLMIEGGEHYSVKISANLPQDPQGQFRDLQVVKKNGRLVISQGKVDTGWLSKVKDALGMGDGSERLQVKAVVTLPTLSELRLQGHALAWVKDIRSKELMINLSDSSYLKQLQGNVQALSLKMTDHSRVGELSLVKPAESVAINMQESSSIRSLDLSHGVNQLPVRLAGVSNIRQAEGRVEQLDARFSGSSNLNLSALQAHHVNVDGRDTANARVQVVKLLDGQMQGSAHLDYIEMGTPQIGVSSGLFSAVNPEATDISEPLQMTPATVRNLQYSHALAI
ncbi:GIN domain-containing protein [Dongshaea marina]|uniref:GIN domain-containing protein n=1 Tax=Dongshaea marina TaxID=2047966 RepID=UPI000D3E271D|nr:DUF2807 domain-containing protein [Dongshaea marina]